jgi:hypothetical protein
MKYSSCFFVLYFIHLILFAQPSTENFDSLAIAKPKTAKTQYELLNDSLSAIQLKWKNPKRGPHTVGQMAGDASRNMLTSILGGTIATSQDMNWELTTELSTNNDNHNWKVVLFCSGELEKESHRVRNDDGSHSLEKQKTAHLFWEKGTSGVIVEKEDTIGRFEVYFLPLEDSSLTGETLAIFEERDLRPVDPWGFNFHGTHYTLKGIFRGEKMQVLFNGETNKGWIYLKGRLVSLFQTDNEPRGSGTTVIIGKKAKSKAPPRLAPYLLYDKNNSVVDCLRLGMMSRMVEGSVSQNSWDY